MSAHDARTQRVRVALGLLLPGLLALPSWSVLRSERAALQHTRDTLEAELTRLAKAERLGEEHQRLRADVTERLVIIEALDQNRMRPIAWLEAMGRLPPGVVLSSASLEGDDWVVSGRARSVERLDETRAALEQSGLRLLPGDPVGQDDAGVEFELRGTLRELPADRAP